LLQSHRDKQGFGPTAGAHSAIACRPASRRAGRAVPGVGAIAADSKEADAAKAFITYLKTPEAAAVFKAKGVKPG
jgi:ABC-type glycerol-3-phosphate transport system substrate-binding protein